MKALTPFALALIGLTLVFASGAAYAEYPSCKNDGDCLGGEACVAGECAAPDDEVYFYEQPGGSLAPLTTQALRDEMQQDARCLYHSIKKDWLICVEAQEVVSGRVQSLVIVDLLSGYVQRFEIDRELCEDDGEYESCDLVTDKKALQRFNDKIAKAGDWSPVEAWLDADYRESPPKITGDNPIKLTDTVKITLSEGEALDMPWVDDPPRARSLRVEQGSETLAQARRLRRRLWRSRDPRLPLRGQPCCDRRSHRRPTPRCHRRSIQNNGLALTKVELPAKAKMSCPKEAQCPKNYGQIYPLMDRFCSQSFEQDSLLALAALAQDNQVQAEDLVVLFNSYGAMTGYSFKSEALRAFYYGAGIEEEVSWLPKSCSEVIAQKPSKGDLPKSSPKCATASSASIAPSKGSSLPSKKQSDTLESCSQPHSAWLSCEN